MDGAKGGGLRGQGAAAVGFLWVSKTDGWAGPVGARIMRKHNYSLGKIPFGKTIFGKSKTVFYSVLIPQTEFI